MSDALPELEGGWSLTGLAVDNLRALRMEGPIRLRRLMLVVGRNGIGKSTLARVFPLLRQSTGNRTREPLLWWDDGGVDFGTFGQALRRGASDLTLRFDFTRGDEAWSAQSTLCAASSGSRVARARYSSGDSWLEFAFGDAGALDAIRGVHHNLKNYRSDDLRPGLKHQPWRLFGVSDEPTDPLFLLDALGWIFHGNTNIDRRREVLLGLPTKSRKEALHYLQSQSFGAKYSRAVAEISTDKLNLGRKARVVWDAVERLRLAEALVEELADRTAYIGPFRAVPERSYRYQGVSVEHLDSRGDNLAMYITALSEPELASLNAFLGERLGVTVASEPVGGQYRLMLTLADGRFDLIDTGFGYSQVLPVAVQLWASSRVVSTSRTQKPLAALVVEQPELHLHPHHQTLVARAFAGAAAEPGGPVMFVETHSDHFVSEVGLLVASGALPPERVGVLCVEPRPAGDGAAVRLATYDDDGVLENWPVGFMAP